MVHSRPLATLLTPPQWTFATLWTLFFSQQSSTCQLNPSLPCAPAAPAAASALPGGALRGWGALAAGGRQASRGRGAVQPRRRPLQARCQVGGVCGRVWKCGLWLDGSRCRISAPPHWVCLPSRLQRMSCSQYVFCYTAPTHHYPPCRTSSLCSQYEGCAKPDVPAGEHLAALQAGAASWATVAAAELRAGELRDKAAAQAGMEGMSLEGEAGEWKGGGVQLLDLQSMRVVQ